MSSRHTRSFFGVMLAVVFAFSAVIAVPASAKLSKSQKVHIRHQLRKQIKKHPKMIRNKHWLKKAALVNFKLPVTLRLRGANTPCNPPYGPVGSCVGNPNPGIVPGGTNANSATVDLGAALGQREVDLGGKLAAEITFPDSYDGGALGNVNLEILPSTTKGLTSTSIPLLWNTQVSSGSFESNDLFGATGASGCGNLTTDPTNPSATSPVLAAFADGTSRVAFGTGALDSPVPGPDTDGLPGYPVSNSAGITPSGFLPIRPGINDTKSTTVGPRSGTQPGNNDIVGGNPNPFPSSPYTDPNSHPTSFTTGNPTAKDTVLRTNALDLNVATPGTPVNQTDSSTNGPNGSQNIVIGKSGGQANLFGDIPGKSYGIDVTLSLATRINSILRVVDQDAYHNGVYHNLYWPAGLFNCQQVWTGGVQNYIPDVRLVGGLKIAPGLTSDGHLRIAKATVASQPNFGTRFAVSACLFPHTTYAKTTGNLQVVGPLAGGYTNGMATTGLLPVDGSQFEPKPAANCNSTPSALVQNSGLAQNANLVSTLVGATNANGYTVANDGSKVTVAADLKDVSVSIDVLIGDV